MGARFPTAFTTTFIASVPASGAETVICTTPPLILPYDGALVFIDWEASFLIGTGTTLATIKVIRGTTTAAPHIAGPAQTVVAGNNVVLSGNWVDQGAGPSEPVYSLSAAGTGTTGAWTNGEICLIVFAL
jgi:hypothetical protein